MCVWGLGVAQKTMDWEDIWGQNCVVWSLVGCFLLVLFEELKMSLVTRMAHPTQNNKKAKMANKIAAANFWVVCPLQNV
jgi:hypothetical protein